MTSKLSSDELRSQLEALVKDKEPQVVALSTDADFEGETLECCGRTYLVRKARSVLEFHDHLLQTEERPLLCLTQLEDGELGLDLRVRLYKRRILSTDAWQTVKHLFGCRDLESSLVRQSHLAKYLLKCQPPQGYAKVKGDVLTADKVWSCLFSFRLGMPRDYLDNLSLLEWAAGDCSAYLQAPGDLKESARERVIEICGDLGRAVLDSLEHGKIQPIALGLALRCLYAPEGESLTGTQREALVRLEASTGGEVLKPEVVREWADAAEYLYNSLPEPDTSLLTEADRILKSLQAENSAAKNSLLPGGLKLRLESLAEVLSVALATNKNFELVQEACDACLAHRLLTEQYQQRLAMLPRLLRWLDVPDSKKKLTLAALSRQYAMNTSFAEWARLRCEGQTSSSPVAPHLSSLLSRVADKLESQAEAFAKGLAAWNSAGEPEAGIWKIEDVVDRLLVPIVEAKGGRFLMVVLDGCAWSTIHEVMESFPAADWRNLAPEKGDGLPQVLAAYPSVTECSRTSLLSGRLVSGNASTESKSFSEHVRLRAACNKGRPPVLFHKGDLKGEHDRLSSEVESKIADTKYKAVAVVLNAIDDHLEKDDQIVIPWSLGTIRFLTDLVTLAHQSGRILVLASDHGHVLERGSELLHSKREGGARWQSGRKPEQGEIVLSGPRVLIDADSVVLPWSERIRYTMKKNGYHGGCHPSEILAPLLVLAPEERDIPGWAETGRPKPVWWQRPMPKVVPPAPSADLVHVVEESKKSEPADGQMMLIEEPVEKPKVNFIDAALSFPTIEGKWSEQDADVDKSWARRLLKELETRGDKAPVSLLAAELGQSEERFRKLFVQVANLLTVDGNYLVNLTPDGGSVILSRSVLEGFAPKAQSGTLIEVERTNGDSLSFTVPLKTMTLQERIILESLAKYGQLSEAELKESVRTRRVGGILEKLMERLAKLDFPHLQQSGVGEGGRLYRLDVERLN